MITADSTVKQVRDWLQTGYEGSFAHLVETFQGRNGKHLFGYSEEQLERILKLPILAAALYNALHREE